jgi:hypothetical protein
MQLPELFQTMLSDRRLTERDLNKIQENLYMKLHDAPVWTTGVKKEENIKSFIFWANGRIDRINAVVYEVNTMIKEKAMLPVRGPVPGTRYIKWDDFTKLPSFSILYEAIHYGNKPYTKDGYVSVNMLRNLRNWAGYKSSSLSDSERALANKVEMLHLSALSKLNFGRNADQPLLFPVNMLGV